MRRSNGRTLILSLVALVACAMLGAGAQQSVQERTASPAAQEQAPQQAPRSNQSYQTENPEQLQQLVAPIALYPDSLVASLLAASSYPTQIAQANDFLSARQNFTPEQIAADADKQVLGSLGQVLVGFSFRDAESGLKPLLDL